MPLKDPHYEIPIMIVAGIIVFLVLTGMLSFILFYFQKKKFHYAQQLAEMGKQYTQTLLQTRLEIQEETFKTISQEIHDNIGQSLSFVKLNLNTIDDTSPATKEKITESKNLLTKTIHDLRDIARSLNPDFISELGLYGAIEQQLQLLQKTGEYKTAFMVTGDTYKTDQQRELVVFRIVQELLNNTVKHAAANEVSITMDYQANQLVITVHDNGKGFDIDAMQSVQNNNGLGLRNMLSRMILIKGFITINSKPMEGTTAVIELPKQLNL